MDPVFSSEKLGRNHGNKNTAAKRQESCWSICTCRGGSLVKRCSSKGLSSMTTTNQLGKKIDWEVLGFVICVLIW
ncbi:hypothetical protein Peur_054708 [Populus x canadensis]